MKLWQKLKNSTVASDEECVMRKRKKTLEKSVKYVQS